MVELTLKPKKTCTVNIGNSHLTGLFSVANSNCAVVPQFVEDGEVNKIKRELGINVCRLDDRFSAVKNNVILTNAICIVNPQLPKAEQKKLADCAGVEVVASIVKTCQTIGAVNVATSNGLLAFNNASTKDLEWLCKVLKVPGVRGTCNFGTNALSLGIVANSRGALIGALTTGFESSIIYQALSSGE